MPRSFAPAPRRRARAAVALAAYAQSPAVPGYPAAAAAGAAVAAAFARETNRTVRWHEAWALGRAFPFAPPLAQIRAGLADNDGLVRMAFVDAAAKRGDPRLAALIVPLFDDRSWRVAEEAREGARRISGRSRTAHLRAIPDGVRATPVRCVVRALLTPTFISRCMLPTLRPSTVRSAVCTRACASARRKDRSSTF